MTRENYVKLKDGMKEEEVIAILGKPTDDVLDSKTGKRDLAWREGKKEIEVRLKRQDESSPWLVDRVEQENVD